MFQIAIYDNNKEDAIGLREILKAVLIKQKCNFQLSTYYESTNKVLNKVEQNPFEYDIIVLNICDDDKGFRIAKAIREKNNDSIIIFTAATDDKIYEAFKFRSSGFIIKPVEHQDIDFIIVEAIKYLRKMKCYFYVKTREVLVRIPYKSIDYFESHLRNVRMLLNDETDMKSFRAKLDDVYRVLPKSKFIRCHQSYIVNFENIRYIDRVNKKIIMHSGREVFISKRYYGEIIELFTQCYKNENVKAKTI